MKRVNPKSIFWSLLLVSTVLISLDVSAAFDLDKGIKAAFEPILKAIDDHWGKGVIIAASMGAFIGEGDMRQRAQKSGIGAVSAAAVLLGVKAFFA